MNQPNRGELLAALKQKRRAADIESNIDREEIYRRIKDGKVIPIVSNATWAEKTFLLSDPDNRFSIDAQLSQIWAEIIEYPLADGYDLARVALYNRVNSEDPEHAKRKYLNFLKDALLELAKGDAQVADLVSGLRAQVNELSVADVAQELGFPRYNNPDANSLRLLARMNLPIYVTTSYFDFMERAIRAEGREPRSQLCFWSGEETAIAPEHQYDPKFLPSRETPLVYHLFGLEKYPRTLVLSEDDFLEFLVEISRGIDANRPLIPLYLSEALRSNSLILLGYRLYDWDFRVLFRGIIKPGLATLRSFGLVVQLDATKVGLMHNEDETKAQREATYLKYLSEYFRDSDFKVNWGDTDTFVQTLWDSYHKWSQGQL
jgi:SIR2-like protein